MQKLDLKYTAEERRQLQAFLVHANEQELPPKQENWIPIQSLLSEQHSILLFGLRDEDGNVVKNASGKAVQSAKYPAAALCYTTNNGDHHTAKYNALVPPDAKIVYVRRVHPANGDSDPNDPRRPARLGGSGPDDNDDYPMYIPAVSGGMY